MSRTLTTIQFVSVKSTIMTSKFFVCLVVALVAAQCGAIRDQKLKTHDTINKFHKWVKSKELYFNNRIEDAAKKLNAFKMSLLSKAHAELLEPVTRVEEDLATWELRFPKKCYGPAQVQLQQLKKASVREFFHCSNLTNAVKDVEKIISKVADMTVMVLKLWNTVLTGLDECMPYFTPKGMACVQEYVRMTLEEYKSDVPEMKKYFAAVVAAGKDLKAQVKFCLHPSSTKLNTELTHLLTSLNTCAQ